MAMTVDPRATYAVGVDGSASRPQAPSRASVEASSSRVVRRERRPKHARVHGTRVGQKVVDDELSLGVEPPKLHVGPLAVGARRAGADVSEQVVDAFC
eukprot:5390693-Prymnesium_polylepis.1